MRRQTAAALQVAGPVRRSLEIPGPASTQAPFPADILPAGWSVELRPLASARPLAPEWRGLMARAIEPNVFASPEVMISAAQHLPTSAAPLALFIRYPRGLIAVMALRARAWRLLPRAAEVFSTPFHPVGIPLIDRHHFAPAIRAITAWMRSPARYGMGGFSGAAAIPGLLLPRVPLEGPFFRALTDLAMGGDVGLEMLDCYDRPFLHAAGPDTAPPVSPRHRQNLRRLKRRLDDLGSLRIEEAKTGRALNDSLETLMALEALGWKGRCGTALAQNTRTASFVRSMVRQLAPHGDVAVYTLRSAETPVAAALVVGHLGRHYCFKIAYNPDFARFSPGIILAEAVGEHLLLQPGFVCADSAADDETSFMNRVWPGRTKIADVILHPTESHKTATRAMLAHQHMSRAVRGAAKGLYHQLLGRRGDL